MAILVCDNGQDERAAPRAPCGEAYFLGHIVRTAYGFRRSCSYKGVCCDFVTFYFDVDVRVLVLLYDVKAKRYAMGTGG